LVKMVMKWIKRILCASLSIVLVIMTMLIFYCLFHVNYAEKSLSEYKSQYNDVSIEETKYDISDTEIRMLSIYGSNDTIVGSSYEEYESNNSSKTTAFCLDGGNHAQFGDYGKQLGDSDATISADEQRSITADLIVDWL